VGVSKSTGKADSLFTLFLKNRAIVYLSLNALRHSSTRIKLISILFKLVYLNMNSAKCLVVSQLLSMILTLICDVFTARRAEIRE
jgi:hypothetical protein